MGFFDFIRGTGKNVELNPHALKAEIGDIGYNPDAYEVIVYESTVTVRGMAATQEEREKIILALGNIEGVEKVEDQIAIQAPPSMSVNPPVSVPGAAPASIGLAPQVESQFYTVKSGDTLSKIANHFYGNPNAYMTIFTANNPMLKDPDKIYPGQVLRIPERGNMA